MKPYSLNSVSILHNCKLNHRHSGVCVFVCVSHRALQVVRKVDILTPLGALYYNTGRYEEALEVYREAATLQPDSTDIWLALVRLH